MKKLLPILLFVLVLGGCTQKSAQETQTDKANITSRTIKATVKQLTQDHPNANKELMERGVKHAASLWHTSDGTETEFQNFCKENYISESEERDLVFHKVSRNLEILQGHFNKITLDLLEPVHLNTHKSHPIDNAFGSYSVGSHWMDDFYRNKLAFTIALNFPAYKLEEKEKLGKDWNRLEWAYARLGDVFTSRVPAELLQDYSKANADASRYIAHYNIYMGSLRDKEGNTFFPEDKVLLSHWNLRDEIKANYANKVSGLEKQEMIYQVMKRIIAQDIPEKVINNGEYQWDPYTNEVYMEGKVVNLNSEPDTRYLQIINNFKALRAIDAYSGEQDTYIKRKFDGEMEISQTDVEKLFTEFLGSKELKKVGELVKERLGRDLQPFDIWYDGFKTRSTMDESKLDAKTRKLYPNPRALEDDLYNLLKKLGFDNARAQFLADHISVDPARGSGHAWGASMKGEKAHLRTRIGEKGMDYKGYNIAVHEFGHNVEQTISLHDVDYYTMNGVPNTAFTEALAFIFQKRDLQLLGIHDNNPQKKNLQTLDILWSTYEIMGVSLLDMRVWKWLYAHPQATPTELKAEVIHLSKEIWNEFYAPVYGSKDETILAIYSHMVSYPLYLSAYAFGNLIEFQLEQHLAGKDFANEVVRIYKQGRLAPNEWMVQATGNKLSPKPMLKAASKALKGMK
ncbi:MAG: hypothetical protein ACEPOZ_11200 [Marinifilaceae bacterium]